MLRDLAQLDTPAERVPEITEFWSAWPEAGATSDRPHPRYVDQHRTPRQNIVVPEATAAHRSARLAHLHDDGMGA
jgi:hypothetical protein